MALNIGKQIDSKPKNGSLSQDFMQKHKITVNEPVQTHFSVQGVQTYSADEIKAMKIRADRVNAQKDAYKIDDEIDFGDRPNTQKQQFRTTFKAKSKKQQLQEAKPNNQDKGLNPKKGKVLKPSIRNQMSRTNQQSVKLTKHLQKKEILQQKMLELSNKYKKHFGNDKPKQSKNHKQKTINREEQVQQAEQEIQNDPQIQLQEEQGEQMLPSFDKKQKSTTTLPKTNKHKNESVSHDDSFEQIQWAQPQKDSHNVSMSSSKAGAYSQRLGDAVHFLFD